VKAASLILATVLLAGCGNDDHVYFCAVRQECTLKTTTGYCEETGFCSFPDRSCPSGRRYGDYAAPDYAGECVITPSDAGVAPPLEPLE
jgi:hypothetical protein